MASNILEPSMLILATEFIFLILLLNTKIIIKHILYLTTDDISLKDNDIPAKVDMNTGYLYLSNFTKNK